MRHKFYYGTHSGHKYIAEPRETWNSKHLRYRRPTLKRTYVKILQFIYDHPNCKRADVVSAVYHRNPAFYNPSRYFAELLWSDLIDYDVRTYKYVLRENGREILRQAYVNELLKIVNGKYPWQAK